MSVARNPPLIRAQLIRPPKALSRDIWKIRGLSGLEAVGTCGKRTSWTACRAFRNSLAAGLVIAPLLFSTLWKTCFVRDDEPGFDPAPLLSLHVETLIRGLA